MDIIEVCGTSDACEQKLKTVGDRTPYLRMLKEIYPQLRRTNSNVDYTVVVSALKKLEKSSRRVPNN